GSPVFHMLRAIARAASPVARCPSPSRSVPLPADRPSANGCDECVELAPHPGCGEMVEVVSRADDLAVADPEHEDARQRERLPGVGDGSLIFELGNDHLGIGRLVNGDVGRPAAQRGACAGWREMLAKLLTGT